MPIVRIHNETSHRIPKKYLTVIASNVLCDLKKETYLLDITITTNASIQLLNKQYRHINRPTDVLSFSLEEGVSFPNTQKVLGDIIISIEMAKKQAALFNVTLNHELARLMIHGILHLCGYDHVHVSPLKRNKMFNLQKLLEKKYILTDASKPFILKTDSN